MVFSSLIFLFVFLPITLGIYFFSPKSLKNFVLLVMSLIFYAWGEPIYFTIMVFSTIFDFTNGILIEKYRTRKKLALGICIFSCAVNLGILAFFKYYGFVVDNINALFNIGLTKTNLPLPVGISFYTFQTMSYVIDVYRKRVQVQRNILTFGAFVTLFPQLVAGPIIKYGEIEAQLNNRRVNIVSFGKGVERLIMGLGKKVLIANNIGNLWHLIKASSYADMSVLTSWIGILAFTLQIYFDFSGYSDMAIGLGKMLGFDFPENFNYPYVSRSITDFWRRWHISLGSWFKEYVYIPLGGNRNGMLLQFRNILIVWFLTGFWHGANWNFIIWGLYFGALLLIEKFVLLSWLEKMPRFIGHLYAMLCVIIGWVFFEFEKLSNIRDFISAMFGFGGRRLFDSTSIYYLYTNLFIFGIAILFSTPYPMRAYNRLKEKAGGFGRVSVVVGMIAILLISTAFLVNEGYNPFLYFRF